MPVHDWTRGSPGTFHDFHCAWIVEIRNALNGGLLPSDYYAQTEQFAQDMLPAEMDNSAARQRTLVIRHSSGDRILALLEIVSAGNKSHGPACRKFVDKAVAALNQGYHLLLIDLYPPTPRDPQGIHGAMWVELEDVRYVAPPDKPLTLAAYEASRKTTKAYVEPIAVGDPLPDMPLFLAAGWYISVPLEATYQAAYRGVPQRWRRVLEGTG